MTCRPPDLGLVPAVPEAGPGPGAGPRRRRVLLAVVIDAVTGGAFLPLVFLYLDAVTALPTTTIGLLLSLGAFASLLFNPVTGSLVDRMGARRAVMAANLLAAAGFGALIDVGGTARLVLALAAVAFSQRLYWAAWPVFVGEQQAPGESLDSWFALVNATKSASIGIGSAAAAVLLWVGEAGDLRWLVALAVLGSLVCPLLLRGSGAARVPGSGRTSVDATAAANGWRAVLSDRPYLLLTVSHTALTFAWLLLGLALPIYLTSNLRLPAWVPSAALALNTVVVVLAQRRVSTVVRGWRRTRTVAAGAAAFVVGFVVFALVALPAGRPQGLVAAVGLVAAGVVAYGLGECTVGPAASALALDLSPAGLRGRYSALFQTSWTISTVSGPVALAGLMAWSSLGTWAVMALVVALGALGFLLCERLVPARVLHVQGSSGLPVAP